MKTLFLSRFYWPHIGGVEKHVEHISQELIKKDCTVTVLTTKYKKDLKNEEIYKQVKIIRFREPRIKYFGLFYIWWWIFKNRRLIKENNIVHVHDVFIWYLPFRFLYRKKPVYTTFHGWETDYPIKFYHKLQKKLAQTYLILWDNQTA